MAVFTAAASVAGKLSVVTAVAQQVSLGAKNAKVVAARAGETARGFQPITDFINEMASSTIALAATINGQALHLSRAAVAETRAREARQWFVRARERAADAPFVDSIAAPLAQSERTLVQLRRQFKAHYSQLDDLLQQIDQSMRAAKVIATSARVEASVAGEFRANLEGIANDLEQAARTIQEQVMECRNQLAQADSQT